MDFVSIKVSNFLSYQGQEFTGLGTPGLTLIEGVNHDEGGSNGAGKSTPWDALAWCLFGQTVRGLKSDEVINRATKKDCSVSVRFVHKGRDWVVTRYRKHKKFLNRLIVSVDGKSRELGTTALGQENLLKELGIDFDLFRCTIVFAQGETFNFIDETNKKQKEILSKVMRINFDRSLALAKDRLSNGATEIEGAKEKISILKSHRCDPTKKYQDEISKWEESIREEKKSRKLQISESRDEVHRIERVIKPTKELAGLKEKILESIDHVRGQANALIERRGKAKAMLSHWRKKIQDFSDLKKEKECPTCTQKISESGVLEAIEKSVEKAEALDHALVSLNRATDALDSKVSSREERLERIEAAISEHREMSTKLARCQKDLTVLVNDLEKMEQEECPWTETIEKEKKRQKRIETSIKETSLTTKKLEEDALYLKFWETGLGDAGIKSFVFDLICSSLTERANFYVNILTNGQVTIDFDTQKQLKTGELREKFDVSLITGGEKIKYDAYSGGERRRISLATDIALSDIMSDYYGASFNFVVFDEQSNYLDTQGRECFITLLKEMAKKKRVLVVDHDSEMKAKFDDSWVIEKKGGVSRLVTRGGSY